MTDFDLLTQSLLGSRDPLLQGLDAFLQGLAEEWGSSSSASVTAAADFSPNSPPNAPNQQTGPIILPVSPARPFAVLTPEQVLVIASYYFDGNDIVIAAAVAMAESGGDPSAIFDRNPYNPNREPDNVDRGLMQNNGFTVLDYDRVHGTSMRDEYDFFWWSPLVSMEIGAKIKTWADTQGDGWLWWSTYRDRDTDPNDRYNEWHTYFATPSNR